MSNESSFQPAPELLARQPLLDAAGQQMLDRLSQHPHAPRWNHSAGDRLDRAGLGAVQEFAGRLARFDTPETGEPSEAIRRWVASRREHIPHFRESLANDWETHWSEIPTMSREDIAVRPHLIVPDDADLDRMLVYRTAGTTGHALLVPSDPVAVAAYQPMLEFALQRHGVTPEFRAGMVAGFLVGAQVRTVTCPSVLSFWNNAGWAKLNLTPTEWPTPESPHRYFEDLQPFFLTGDPISFSEMLRMQIPAKPAVLVSTAVAMSLGLKRRLGDAYGCPVIDWYSLTETGPIAYACRDGHGYHLLPPDIFVEAVTPDGTPVPIGERGEITITGGRNPFLPMLRYRTGDWGRLDLSPCSCGDHRPRILDLEGRAPVLFRSSTGGIVNPVDLSRVLREFPFVQHEFTQHADLSCELIARPITASGTPDKAAIENALRRLLGPDLGLRIEFDPQLGNRASGSDKVVPFKSELLLED